MIISNNPFFTVYVSLYQFTGVDIYFFVSLFAINYEQFFVPTSFLFTWSFIFLVPHKTRMTHSKNLCIYIRYTALPPTFLSFMFIICVLWFCYLDLFRVDITISYIYDIYKVYILCNYNDHTKFDIVLSLYNSQ